MTYTLEQLPKVWAIFSYELGEFINTDGKQLQAALKDTYALFQKYKNEKNVPREFCEIISAMKDYAINLENEEELPIADYYFAISKIIYSVIDGFLEKNYECDFPVLKIPQGKHKACLFDMENGEIFDVIEELENSAKDFMKQFTS